MCVQFTWPYKNRPCTGAVSAGSGPCALRPRYIVPMCSCSMEKHFIHTHYIFMVIIIAWLTLSVLPPTILSSFSTDFRLLLLLFTATAVHFCFLLFSIERTVILTHLLFFFFIEKLKAAHIVAHCKRVG